MRRGGLGLEEGAAGSLEWGAWGCGLGCLVTNSFAACPNPGLCLPKTSLWAHSLPAGTSRVGSGRDLQGKPLWPSSQQALHPFAPSASQQQQPTPPHPTLQARAGRIPTALVQADIRVTDGETEAQQGLAQGQQSWISLWKPLAVPGGLA